MAAKVIISTGDLHSNYEILDTIFAMDSHTEGFFGGGADPNKAFANVKNELQKACVKVGGNAVINCQFDYRVALNGKKQSIEIFAYGTAVKA